MISIFAKAKFEKLYLMLYFSKVSSCDLAAATTLENYALLYMHLHYKQPFFNRLQVAILQPTTSSHSSTDYKQPFINRLHHKPPLYEQTIKIRNKNFTQTLLKLFVNYIMLLNFLVNGYRRLTITL